MPIPNSFFENASSSLVNLIDSMKELEELKLKLTKIEQDKTNLFSKAISENNIEQLQELIQWGIYQSNIFTTLNNITKISFRFCDEKVLDLIILNGDNNCLTNQELKKRYFEKIVDRFYYSADSIQTKDMDHAQWILEYFPEIF